MPESIMDSMMAAVIAAMRSADHLTICFFMFLVAFMKHLVPPFPGDTPIALIGYLLSQTGLGIFWAVLWPSLGSTLGFMVMYHISRRLEKKLYAVENRLITSRWEKQLHWFFPPSEIEIVRQRFTAHGYLAVLFNRFLFGYRAVVSLVTGLMRLNNFLVLLSAALSATAWSAVLIYGGYLLGRNWQHVGGYVAAYSIPVTVLFMALIVMNVLHYCKDRKERTDQAG
jgi:membrane protein DedA with SNARE-associated domain